MIHPFGALIRAFYSFLLLLLCYALCRLVFVFQNHLVSLAQPIPSLWQRWISAMEFGAQFFWSGLRFDASAITLLNIPFFAALLFGAVFSATALGKRIYSRGGAYVSGLMKLSFWTVNITYLWANIADAFYFPFSGKRSTLAVFAVKQDITHQAVQLIMNFWIAGVFCAAITMVFVVGERAITKATQSLFPPQFFSSLSARARVLSMTAAVTLMCGIFVLLARGGLQRKPLSLPSAYELVAPEHVPFVLNTTFTVLKAYGSPPPPEFTFLTANDLMIWQQSRISGPTSSGILAGRNVVILILESFGREYLGNGSTSPCYAPFVCELSRTGVSFEPAYANGRTSIESFYSIHAGLPSLHSQPLVTSQYGANRVPGLPDRLRDAGYETLFFHGGRNGTMFFDAMAKAVGIDNYYGLNEYMKTGKSSDSDGVWGVYDEPMLNFTVRTLDTVREPFFASVFTLSSHNPYFIPPEKTNTFPKGTLPIHESIGYTDWALQQFFEKARESKWFSNTVFFVTADHTSISNDPSYNNIYGHFRIPLIIVDGKNELTAKIFATQQPAQQIDIAPTVIDLMGLKPGMESFYGRSLVGSPSGHVIINRNSDLFWGLNEHGSFEILADGASPNRQDKTDEGLEQTTKALIQSYFEALVSNRFNEDF
jgi:phosphoglycerol transferase MdoB-like AlkP superfamily enzyme